jgi:hypothetical protein
MLIPTPQICPLSQVCAKASFEKGEVLHKASPGLMQMGSTRNDIKIFKESGSAQNTLSNIKKGAQSAH